MTSQLLIDLLSTIVLFLTETDSNTYIHDLLSKYVVAVSFFLKTDASFV